MKLSKQLIDVNFPNGMQFYCLPSSHFETKFIYHEIFEQKTYLQHGISISDGQTIVDAGANIGMFVRFALQECPRLHIYSLEPTPPIFEVLKANVCRFQKEYSGEVEIFPVGLSNENSFRDITFFPRAPGNSTIYLDEKQQEPAVIADAISVKDVWKYDKVGCLGLVLLYPFRRFLIRSRLRKLYRKKQTYRCELITLSHLIEEQGIDSIDLLKIDVEGSELDILSGIRDEHWDRIQQIVIEIAPCNSSRVHQLTKDLAERGFLNINLQSMGHDVYIEEGNYPCNLYASRNAAPVAN